MTVDEMVWVALPLFVVGGFLAAAGQGIASALGESQHRAARLWHRTRALHPIAAGMLLGLSTMPVPPALGEGTTARLVWYGLAGGLAVPIYEVWRAMLARRAA